MTVRIVRTRRAALGLALLLALGLVTTSVAARRKGGLAGDWDVYIALSARPHFGFEGWRRMAFAHFAGTDSGNVGYVRRRTGQPLLTVSRVSIHGDSVILTQDTPAERRAVNRAPGNRDSTMVARDTVVMRAAWHGDTLAGLLYTNG
ncbi:MAG: hypothetical protein ACREK8_08885, partial [Gemmatimonadales bacterium]